MEEKTREELMEQINNLSLTEVTNLEPMEDSSDGGADMLVGGAIGAGLTALIGLGIWGVGKIRKKKAEKKAKKEAKVDAEVEKEPELSEEELSEVEKELTSEA